MEGIVEAKRLSKTPFSHHQTETLMIFMWAMRAMRATDLWGREDGGEGEAGKPGGPKAHKGVWQLAV